MRSDTDFLGLTRHGDTKEFSFTVEDRLARMDGALYGGTAIAVSIAAAEEVTARHAVWMTTQFVSTVGLGAEVRVEVEILALGKRTNQVRVTGRSVKGAVVFASLGATGHHREGGLTGEFENAPTVTGPDDRSAWTSPFAGMAEAAGVEMPEPPEPRDSGFAGVVEMRGAEILEHPDPGPGRICLWIRRKDGGPITPAVAAYLADMVPMSIARACGELAAGTSLDNTIRVGSFPASEWILLDLRPHLAVGDYGHGVAHVWSDRGHLMASASQTAALFRIDPANLPWRPRS